MNTDKTSQLESSDFPFMSNNDYIQRGHFLRRKSLSKPNLLKDKGIMLTVSPSMVSHDFSGVDRIVQLKLSNSEGVDSFFVMPFISFVNLLTRLGLPSPDERSDSNYYFICADFLLKIIVIPIMEEDLSLVGFDLITCDAEGDDSQLYTELGRSQIDLTFKAESSSIAQVQYFGQSIERFTSAESDGTTQVSALLNARQNLYIKIGFCALGEDALNSVEVGQFIPFQREEHAELLVEPRSYVLEGHHYFSVVQALQPTHVSSLSMSQAQILKRVDFQRPLLIVTSTITIAAFMVQHRDMYFLKVIEKIS